MGTHPWDEGNLGETFLSVSLWENLSKTQGETFYSTANLVSSWRNLDGLQALPCFWILEGDQVDIWNTYIDALNTSYTPFRLNR